MQIDKRNRAELKQFFVKNAIPTEKNFADLVDGQLNQKDDGIVKQPNDALSIEAFLKPRRSDPRARYGHDRFRVAGTRWIARATVGGAAFSASILHSDILVGGIGAVPSGRMAGGP